MFKFIFLSIILVNIVAHLGIDIYLPRDDMSCVVKSGYNYIVTRAFSKSGVVD